MRGKPPGRYGIIKVVKFSGVPHFVSNELSTTTLFTEAVRFRTREDAARMAVSLEGFYRLWDFDHDRVIDGP